MVYMYHSFLIHSSADGHLGCFHVLAMINSAAMNIGVHVSLSDLVSIPKLVQPLWKKVWRFLKKLEIELPYDPAIPVLGIHTKEIRSIFFHSSQCFSLQSCLQLQWYTYLQYYFFNIHLLIRL